MKKLMAILVIFALFAGTAFAQEEESSWKVGFMAQYSTDLLWATKGSAKGESEVKRSGYSLATQNGTWTKTAEYGKYNKGSFNFLNSHNAPTDDHRILLSFSNSGENHEVYADIAMDNWYNGFSSIWDFIQNGSADWWVKGNAGIFDAVLGTAGYGGAVSAFGTWNNFAGTGHMLSRFGVWRPYNGLIIGNEFRTWSQWGSVFALGATFLDSFKFALGYRMLPDEAPYSYNNPWLSASSINASFLLSAANIADMLSVDLFYAVKGEDDNTAVRVAPPATNVRPNWDNSKYGNIIGVYLGLSAIDNLGLSIGYTGNFNAYEKYSYHATRADANPVDPNVDARSNAKAGSVKSPLFSGIDIHINFTGIEDVGVTFNNRLSFAGAKGVEVKEINKGTPDQWYVYDTVTLGLDGSPVSSISKDAGNYKENWFGWQAELQASYKFLTLNLNNQLGVFSSEDKYSSRDANEVITDTTTSKGSVTTNVFHVSLTASHNVGAVTILGGLYLSLDGATYKGEREYSVVGSGKDNVTYKSSATAVGFGVPLLVKVAF